MDKSKRNGIHRCDICGGVLECRYSERTLVAACICKDKRGVQARGQANLHQASAVAAISKRKWKAREVFRDFSDDLA